MTGTVLTIVALLAAFALLRRRLPQRRPTPAELWNIHHRPHWD